MRSPRKTPQNFSMNWLTRKMKMVSFLMFPSLTDCAAKHKSPHRIRTFPPQKKKDSTKFNKISNSSTICAKSKGSIWNRLIFVILNIYDYIFLETPIYVIKQTKTAKITPNRNRTTSQKWLTIVTDSDLLLFSRFLREKL